MSRHVGEFDDTCMGFGHDPDTTPQGAVFRPQAFDEMRDAGFPIEEIHDIRPAISEKDDGNTGYLVFDVETLEYPLGHAKCDAVNRTRLWVCSCPGWNFHHNKEFPADTLPSQVDPCPHVELAQPKSERAQNDENQQQLASQ